MKVYQISYRGRGILNGEHRGYEYVSSIAEAKRRIMKNTNDQNGPDDIGNPIYEFNVSISKDGILKALNQHGGHPDNG